MQCEALPTSADSIEYLEIQGFPELFGVYLWPDHTREVTGSRSCIADCRKRSLFQGLCIGGTVISTALARSPKDGSLQACVKPSRSGATAAIGCHDRGPSITTQATISTEIAI